MADDYRRSSKHSKHSKRSKESRSKYECRTPPLIPKHTASMDELLKQRDLLKEQLKNMSRHSEKTSKYDSKKRSHHETENGHKKIKTKHEKLENDSTRGRKSPVFNVENNPTLDSEDEETIIELRRKERKRLIEQLLTNQEPSDRNMNKNDDHKVEKRNEELPNENISKTQNTKNDITDMFAEEDFTANKSKVTQDNSLNSSKLTDNWDDEEGYYNIRVGDIINNNRYTIKSLVGQGVFANVVKAQDTKTSNEVAIKIMRNNDLMYKTGLKEIATLKEINASDPSNKYHCVRMESHFMHKNHLCLVLESLHMDLRGVLKKYGRHHGLNIKALTSYSIQLLLALRLLKKVGIIHADIKPDNVLVNEKKNVLKLCDFGSAFKVNENEPTPYLVSRFYRAPEVILGIQYGHGVDMWSTACTMFEMATGKIMFTGNSNNRMLKCFMDLKGRIPSRLIRKGKFKDQHFNYNNNFLLHKKDEFSGREKLEEISNITAGRDILKEIKKSRKDMVNGEEKKIGQLKDLLDKMLMIDPSQRISITESLKHPFVQELEK